MKHSACPLWLMVACFALLNGCGGSSTTGEGATQTAGDGGRTAGGGSASVSCTWRPGCSARSEVDCESDGQCEAYAGRACGTESSGFVVCGKPKGACDDALTCGQGPYGQQFMFPNGCIPEGWSTCPVVCD